MFLKPKNTYIQNVDSYTIYNKKYLKYYQDLK